MLKKIVAFATLTAFLSSCSSLKTLTSPSQSQASAAGKDVNAGPKFLDIDEDSDPAGVPSSSEEKPSKTRTVKRQLATSNDLPRSNGSSNYSSVQVKYSQLLNTDADRIQNVPLYTAIDDWYGTRYQLGGTTKAGIDCSAFVQTIFGTVFGVTLPRTAKDQYRVTRHISRTDLQEGDLLFFNTLGGVSHVGIYLQNNKFVHASVSGVMISDMFEPYYVKHFISAGRVSSLSSVSVNP
ncbi:MAG TPA: NlpC/P60 family protein [Chitinophagaceae bacterium]|jgi:lipoprotein Spr